jgi:ATP-dependent RNA helicase DDX46/PRP5
MRLRREMLGMSVVLVRGRPERERER